MSEQKSNSKADEFRNKGNENFQRWQFLEALECYNKSLCFALPASQQIPLAYANRSAVYIEAKLYQKCLDNIELARAHGYQKPEKLKEREIKCKNLMKDYVEDPGENPWNFFKLSHPANEKLPFIVNCLELRENKKYGRYIVTNTALKTGDIIALEEPYVCSTYEDSFFQRCANCCKHNMLSLIPTDVSCTKTMYCSDDCREDNKHLPDELQSVQDLKKEYRFLIAVVKVVAKHVKIAGSAEKLRRLVDKLVDDLTSTTVFDFDLSNNKDPMYQINMLLAVNSLARQSGCLDTIALINKETFFNTEPFDSMATSQEDREFIFEYLMKQAAVLATNLFAMNEASRTIAPSGIKHAVDHQISFGLFPFASLFNHSCDPNTMYCIMDNKLCLFAARPILAGEQLFISYGFEFNRHTRTERQQRLAYYKFKCECNACVQNYPLLKELKPKLEREHLKSMVVFKCTTVRDAISQFKKNAQNVEKNFKHHPCLETTASIVNAKYLIDEISKIRFDDLKVSVNID